MGRLLRKKIPAKKKIKTGDSDAVSSANGAAGGDSPAPAAPARRPAAAPSRKPPPVAAERGYIARSIQFLREVKAELKKVAWPSRKQTIGSTAVVLVVVAIISLFLGFVDMGLQGLIRIVLR
jgi:preprotein translocase subunit SecE